MPAQQTVPSFLRKFCAFNSVRCTVDLHKSDFTKWTGSDVPFLNRRFSLVIYFKPIPN